jgi:outer membrane protein OmpA-like peptidoglycan-associated protein
MPRISWNRVEPDYSAPDHRCTLSASLHSMRSSRTLRVVALTGLWLVLAAGCAVPSGGDSGTKTAPPSSGTPPPATPEPAPVPPAAFADVVARAGEQLLREAQAVVGGGPRELVIDPLIDASTGQQTAGSVQMGQQLGALIKSRMPHWSLRPLTRTSVASQPLLLIGTLTAINTKGVRDENADAFRVCLTLVDLRTGKVVAKQVGRATLATVSAEPTPFFRDSPTWALDRTAAAYIKSCQGSSPGESVDPAYLLRLPAAAIVAEAQAAFAENKLAEAYRLFREAQPVADPDDLRILNGLYLAGWRLGKKKEATETFGRIVGIGLDSKKLPIKIFFNPRQTTLLASADLQTQYAVWLREVAFQVGVRETCMKVVGHTSRTGSAAANLALSQRRAAIVKQTLERLNKSLDTRLSSEGVGANEVIVGLGTDDMRDALDRRVEFRTIDCS